MTIQTLHNLVHQFNAHEQLLIRYGLKGSKEEIGGNKSLRLFEYLLLQKKNISRRGASFAMYQVQPDTRINKLITRLWGKILDIIISENFIRKNERLSQQSILRITVRKKTAQCATLLLLNGNSKAYNELSEEAIKDATKSEYHIMLFDLYHLKRASALFQDNIKEYEFCNTQMIYHRKCHDVEQKAFHYYNELTKHDGYGNILSPEKRLESVERFIAGLKKEKKYIISVYPKYLFCMIQLEGALLRENFVQAKKLLYNLREEVGFSFVAGGQPRVAMRIESELCNCELNLGNYDQALKHCEKAAAILWSGNKLNYYICISVLFQTLFYIGDINRAEKILAELLSDQNPIRNDFRAAKPQYFQACLHFKKEEYKQSLEIVNKPMPLNKDKTGFDIAIRILRIQCLLRLNRFDEASSHIENLRKHINRNYKKTYTRERDKLISRVLVLMQKRGFSGQANKTESELIKKLSLSSGQFKWVPKTHELIRFHDWYKETAESIPSAKRA